MKKKMCEPGLTNTPIMDRLLDGSQNGRIVQTNLIISTVLNHSLLNGPINPNNNPFRRVLRYVPFHMYLVPRIQIQRLLTCRPLEEAGAFYNTHKTLHNS